MSDLFSRFSHCTHARTVLRGGIEERCNLLGMNCPEPTTFLVDLQSNYHRSGHGFGYDINSELTNDKPMLRTSGSRHCGTRYLRNQLQLSDLFTFAIVSTHTGNKFDRSLQASDMRHRHMVHSLPTNRSFAYGQKNELFTTNEGQGARALCVQNLMRNRRGLDEKWTLGYQCILGV